ncbi:Glutaredoxin [Macleaya cordata]|uniref:Glutaredoxin n=1 Tax=Macleaya cordata TaxID=56857 RepID=A0A200QL79_MACCD|nr:Glutaredoxin [Macleaya cordata]
MQKAVPYRTWLPIKPESQISRTPSAIVVDNLEDPLKRSGSSSRIKLLVSENAVLVFGRRGCCMCHVIKRLLLGLGVNPAVYEVVDEADEIAVANELSTIDDNNVNGVLKPQFPCVYIGGKLFGGLDKLMAAHITGELIPILKQVGALWL